MAHGALTPIIGLRLLALAAGLRHNAEIGRPGLCFSAYGHKFGITIWRLKACRTEAAMVERVRPDVSLPQGTVTFLFTDVEGSTRLLQELGDGYGAALTEHRRVLREAFRHNGGVEVDTQGDAFFVAFATASDGLAAAAAGRDALAGGPIRVRMGLHTGEPVLTDGGYVGIDVHRAARIAAAGHGGQVLVSQSTRDLAGEDGLRDLGEHRLKDLTAPERIFQLGEGEFPPLKSLHQTNLPVQPMPLIGRERELVDVLRQIGRASCRERV